jgi:hypothetical protein
VLKMEGAVHRKNWRLRKIDGRHCRAGANWQDAVTDVQLPAAQNQMLEQYSHSRRRGRLSRYLVMELFHQQSAIISHQPTPKFADKGHFNVMECLVSGAVILARTLQESEVLSYPNSG